jgi:hypothetical protein
MSNELMKNDDGFEGFEAGTEGGDQRQGVGVIQGVVLKFSNEAAWTVVGQRMPEGLELIAVGIARVVQKWIDQLPAETRVLAPGEKFPDLEKLNNATPRNEWHEDLNGVLCGPWQRQHIVYLLDPATMDRYTFPTGTTGGAIAVRELVEKTTWMRRYRGQHVCPVVTLSDTFMKTRFGGRQRPHFIIKRWIELDGDAEKALPTPSDGGPRLVENAAAEKPTPAPVQASPPEKRIATTRRDGTPRRGATVVQEPSLREELNDVPEATREAPREDDRSPEAAKVRLEQYRSRRRG